MNGWLIIYATNNLNWLKKKKVSKKIFFSLCMYKMVLKITKETWEKCGIKTVKHYNEKEDIIELWQKMSDVDTQAKHSNIAEVVLGRIKKYFDKKTRNVTEEEKQKTKHVLTVKKVFLSLKNVHVM